jgi:hypothetical protein
MGTTDEIAANRAKRQDAARVVSELDAEMFSLVKRGVAEKIPIPDLARAAGVTRGRIYQILGDH